MENKRFSATAKGKSIAQEAPRHSDRGIPLRSTQVDLPREAVEEAIGEIRDVMIQYTSCADPTESAARKERFRQAEEQGQVEETAVQMVKASLATQPTQTEGTEAQSSPARIPALLRLGPTTSPPEDQNQQDAQQQAKATTRRKPGRPPGSRKSQSSPNTLAGANSRKRKFSFIGMTTETESSHLTQSSSSLPPQPQNPVDHLRCNDSSTQGLQNDGMNNKGLQILPSDDFYSCIVFNITQLKNILLSCFNPHEPDNIAREANEELSKPQAIAESSHVYQSIPSGEHIQKDVASELVFGTQSLSSAFPPRQTDGGFEALSKNFKQCEIWNGPQGNNNQEDQIVNTIEGSAYTIPRKPLDPIGRPFNPFGPIERPIPRLPSSSELAYLGFA
ncbi:BnaA08g05060D [Brassica napus]|uniref:BnaA08g05060D protein n=1 Tax=Brassica napus TaxID=3708 RepID=A0A078I292_BRANA|nr:BnaA08g05060D [Brassica napus]